MSELHAKFADRFGEDQAAAVLAAALQHRNGIHDDMGSDSFRWAIAITIGHECLTRYAQDHGITADHAEVREWIKTEANLGCHDGDVDYLALLAGAYEDYLPDEAVDS